jgi:hypothetical protein
LLIRIVPSRADAPSFAAARKETLPFPCPEVGDSPEIQFVLVDAVHAHSGSAVTTIELLPPPASRSAGAATETWHLTGSGPVETVDEVSQPAAMIAVTSESTAATKKRVFARTRLATGSTVPTAECVGSKRHSTLAADRLGRSRAEVGLI